MKVLIVLLIGLITTGTIASPSQGCGKSPTIPSNHYNNGFHIPINAANMEREYILNVPTNYNNTHPYRLIIAYHELNGNDDEMYHHDYYHLLPLSGNSAIFVAPNGQQNGQNCKSSSGCGWPNPNDSDILLADAVVAQIEENFCIDTDRIFATGWSYGASMSYETACERPLGAAKGYIRAVAVYSAAQLSGSCKPSKPVAYYASHGTQDTVLNYNYGVQLCENYANADTCKWQVPTKVTSGNHVCSNMTGCQTGYPVEFCSFDGPHTPDPTDPGQRTSWEYQNVWNFLSQF
jgi:poly(3-hydroxybutyrate) depolymerase